MKFGKASPQRSGLISHQIRMAARGPRNSKVAKKQHLMTIPPQILTFNIITNNSKLFRQRTSSYVHRYPGYPRVTGIPASINAGSHP